MPDNVWESAGYILNQRTITTRLSFECVLWFIVSLIFFTEFKTCRTFIFFKAALFFHYLFLHIKPSNHFFFHSRISTKILIYNEFLNCNYFVGKNRLTNRRGGSKQKEKEMQRRGLAWSTDTAILMQNSCFFSKILHRSFRRTWETSSEDLIFEYF